MLDWKMGNVWEYSAVHYVAHTQKCDALLRTPDIFFFNYFTTLIDKYITAGGVMEGTHLKNKYTIIHTRCHIQLEWTNSQVQLGHWDFVEACMLMFTVADTVVAIAIHLRSSALLWLLAVFSAQSFPRNITISIRTSEIAIVSTINTTTSSE